MSWGVGCASTLSLLPTTSHFRKFHWWKIETWMVNAASGSWFPWEPPWSLWGHPHGTCYELFTFTSMHLHLHPIVPLIKCRAMVWLSYRGQALTAAQQPVMCYFCVTPCQPSPRPPLSLARPLPSTNYIVKTLRWAQLDTLPWFPVPWWRVKEFGEVSLSQKQPVRLDKAYLEASKLLIDAF